MESKIGYVENLIKNVLGEDTDSRLITARISSNRCLVQGLVLNYFVSIYVSELDKESDKYICTRLVRELENIEKEIKSDISKLKSTINK